MPATTDRRTTAKGEQALRRLLKDIKNHPDPETGEPTNEQRRGRATYTLSRYSDTIGDPDAGYQSLASDLLTDLMHLADAGVIDFEQALGKARIHHTDEAR